MKWITLRFALPLIEGPSLAANCQKDIHHLCVGILYPIFTGLSPKRGGLRPQPAGINEVDARYSDVSSLDFTIEPTLSHLIIDLLERGARQEIKTAEQDDGIFFDIYAKNLQGVEHTFSFLYWKHRMSKIKIKNEETVTWVKTREK